MSSLTVLTQNIWGGVSGWPARRALLVDRIARFSPDVIALQEVHARPAIGGESQAHELARALGGYRALFAAGRVEATGQCEGVGLLVRHRAHAHDPCALTLDPTDPFEGANRRVVLAATIEHHEGPVDVFATHLSLSRAARTRTVEELLAFIERVRSVSKSVLSVLLGDMNAAPAEPTIARIQASLLDAWSTRGRRRPFDGGTWPAFLPMRRIDYVFVWPPRARLVREVHRVPYAGSDHLGVCARFDLRMLGTH